MKRVCLHLIVISMLWSSAGAAQQGCKEMSYDDLMHRLQTIHFPMALLAKVGLDEEALRDRAPFTECAPGTYGEVSFITSRVQMDRARVAVLELSAFRFPTAEATQSAVRDQMQHDAWADHNPIADIYYYVAPHGTAAFRVERSTEFLLD